MVIAEQMIASSCVNLESLCYTAWKFAFPSNLAMLMLFKYNELLPDAFLRLTRWVEWSVCKLYTSNILYLQPTLMYLFNIYPPHSPPTVPPPIIYAVRLCVSLITE